MSAEQTKAWRMARIAQGLCVGCAIPVGKNQYCSACVKIRRQQRSAYRKRLHEMDKAGISPDKKPSDRIERMLALTQKSRPGKLA